jgi:hypothetical protein
VVYKERSMKEYYITVTYLATIIAENEDEAAAIALADIASGVLEPNDIEIEEK